MREKPKNPHEVSLGRFLRALERPLGMRPYWMAKDGSLRQKSMARCSRKLVEKLKKAKNIPEPAEPRRSWADIQAAWSKRQREVEATEERIRRNIFGNILSNLKEEFGE